MKDLKDSAADLSTALTHVVLSLEDKVRSIVRDEVVEIVKKVRAEDEDPLLTTKEVSQMLRIHSITIRRMRDRREFPEPAISRDQGYSRNLWRRSQVLQFMRDQETK